MSSEYKPTGRPVGKTLTEPEKKVLRTRAFELSAKRMSITDIAHELGVSIPTTYKLIDDGYQEFKPQIREEFHKDLKLIDGLLVTAVRRYLDKEDATIADVDKLLNRRARMLGYDAAVEVSVTKREVTQTDLKIMELVNAAKARNSLMQDELASTDE